MKIGNGSAPGTLNYHDYLKIVKKFLYDWAGVLMALVIFWSEMVPAGYVIAGVPAPILISYIIHRYRSDNRIDVDDALLEALRRGKMRD